MSLVFEEVGRSVRVGGSSADDRRTYIAVGYSTEAAATVAVVAYAPASLGGMVLDEVSAEETEMVETWRVQCTYKLYEKLQPPAMAAASDADPSDEGEMSFDIGVETVRVQFSLGMRRYNVGAHTCPNPNFGINFNPKTKVPEGIDIYDPSFGWSESHYFHEDKMTRTFRRNIMKCVGKTNKALFRGNDPNEVLLMGVSGRKRSQHDYALTYQFKHRENVTDLEVAGVTDITKKGWEYVETVYEASTDPSAGDAPIPDPIGVIVHQVFSEADYSLLGIGS